MSSEKDLLQDSLGEFNEGLNALVPLLHFTEYHEEDKIRKAAQQESNRVLNSFIKKTEAHNDLRVKGDLLKELCLEIEKLIEDHLRKNQDYKAKAESFLKKQTDDICENFKGTYTAKLLLSPDMNLKSAEELLENGKLLALCYFENHSNFENIDLYEEQTRKLQEKLEVVCKEMLEKHGHLLKIRARKSLEDIKKIVRNMSGEIQRDISTLNDVVSGNLRKAKLVKGYLLETGNMMEGKHPELHEELCETLEGVMNYLNEAKESTYMSLENGIEWARRLNQQLHSYFIDEEEEVLGNRTDQKGKGDKVTVIEPVSIASGEPSCQNSNDEIQTGSSKTQRKTQKLNGGQLSDPMKTNEIPDVRKSDLEVNTRQQRRQPVHNALVEAMPSSLLGENINLSSRKNFSEGVISVTDDDGVLLGAIWEGQSVANIKKILDEGANVNIVTNAYPHGNAAHVVISSLIAERQTIAKGFAILSLLVANGFNHINQADKAGWTPLFHATHYDDLNDILLAWFSMNGADFNAVSGDNLENSVLMQAVSRRLNIGVIRDILVYGGNMKHVNKWKANVLHTAAIYAHESAMEIFIDQLDVNSRTMDNTTPLHHLFLEKGLDYLPCLKMLLEKGADFGAKSNEGHVPLVKWMKCCRANPFPTLLKAKEMLPITEEIASATLTAIVTSIDSLRKFLRPSPQSAKEFTLFLTLLIIEKKGKLWLKNESQWKSQMHEKLENIVWTAEFFKAISGSKKWKGKCIEIKANILGMLEFRTTAGSVNATIETVLGLLLVCKSYKEFVDVCHCLIQSGCLRE